MNWMNDKKDKVTNWFQTQRDTFLDFFKESRSTLDEWMNYIPGEGKPQNKIHQWIKQEERNQKQAQQHVKEQKQPTIIQRGLINKIELQFPKSEKERER